MFCESSVTLLSGTTRFPTCTNKILKIGEKIKERQEGTPQALVVQTVRYELNKKIYTGIVRFIIKYVINKLFCFCVWKV